MMVLTDCYSAGSLIAFDNIITNVSKTLCWDNRSNCGNTDNEAVHLHCNLMGVCLSSIKCRHVVPNCSCFLSK